EQEIKLCMKESEYAESGRYRISWSNIETTRLDAKRIKEEEPQIYKDYAKVSTTRRFQIKAA
ncbi:MAG: endonuclease, partial [Butyrivibrio sp.]|nr:endonuclease [Butyrivibrio sp.]